MFMYNKTAQATLVALAALASACGTTAQPARPSSTPAPRPVQLGLAIPVAAPCPDAPAAGSDQAEATDWAAGRLWQTSRAAVHLHFAAARARDRKDVILLQCLEGKRQVIQGIRTKLRRKLDNGAASRQPRLIKQLCDRAVQLQQEARHCVGYQPAAPGTSVLVQRVSVQRRARDGS